MQSSQVRFIDLFCGIGSFHYAFRKIGWKCVMACDNNDSSRKTYEKNYGQVPMGDITKIDPKLIQEYDILCAGFPCQPFSQCGRHEGFKDERGTMFFHVMKFVKYHRPKIVVLENVQALLTHDEGKSYQVIVDSLKAEHYIVQHRLLKCSNYGIPQMRKRLFIFAVNDAIVSHEKLTEVLAFKSYEKKMTLSAFLGRGFAKETAYTIRCGGRNSPITSRHNWDGYLVDGKEYRLTIDDCIKLQGFVDFQLVGTVAEKWRLLGNTIPTIFTEIIGDVLSKFIKSLPGGSFEHGAGPSDEQDAEPSDEQDAEPSDEQDAEPADEQCAEPSNEQGADPSIVVYGNDYVKQKMEDFEQSKKKEIVESLRKIVDLDDNVLYRLYDTSIHLRQIMVNSSGLCLENCISNVLRSHCIPYRQQVTINHDGKIVKTNKGKNRLSVVDFIITCCERYDSINDHIMLSCKTTCRERWTQDNWTLTHQPSKYILITCSNDYPGSERFGESEKRKIITCSAKKRDDRKFKLGFESLIPEIMQTLRYLSVKASGPIVAETRVEPSMIQNPTEPDDSIHQIEPKVDFAGKTVKELRTLCRAAKIKGFSRRKKPELINLLEKTAT